MEVLERPGRRAAVQVARDELVLMEFDMDPRTDGAGPHFHRRHMDSFYVLQGELEVTVAGEVVNVKAGQLVHAAPEVVHSFRNASDGRVRFLNIHTPGERFDEYLRRRDAGEDFDHREYDMWEVD